MKILMKNMWNILKITLMWIVIWKLLLHHYHNNIEISI